MEFEDLSEYDVNLVRSLAIGILTNTKTSCRYDALSETVLGCIYAKGFMITPYPEKLSITISNTLRQKSHGKSWSASDVVKEIFTIIKEMKLTISKDETRNPTWSEPRPSWYTPYVEYKKPWMF